MDRPECSVDRLRDLQAEYYGDEDLRRALQWSASEIEKLRGLVSTMRELFAEYDLRPKMAYEDTVAIARVIEAADEVLETNGPT